VAVRANAEAQWYSLRTQLGAAKFNKAKRGDLNLRLPVGLVRIADDRIALHPDQQVQSILRHIFAEFERLGSAHKILRSLRDQSLLLPRRTDSSWDPEVCWVRPAFAAIYAILKNPANAGAYAYGKLHRTHIPGDAQKAVTHTLPLYPALYTYVSLYRESTLARHVQPGPLIPQPIQWRQAPETWWRLVEEVSTLAFT
jgi:hypothetical protein